MDEHDDGMVQDEQRQETDVHDGGEHALQEEQQETDGVTSSGKENSPGGGNIIKLQGLPTPCGKKTIFAESAGNYVSNPRKTARDRTAYIARHRVNENHNDPLTPGALSRWLLWGESRSLARNTAAFRRRFRLQ